MLSVIKAVSKIITTALVLSIVMCRMPGVHAETPPAQETERINAQIKKKEKEAADFTRREAELIEALDRNDLNLNEMEKKIAAHEKSLATLTEAVKENEAAAAELETEAGKLEKYASLRLVALYKLSRLGTVSLLASSESLFELLTRKKSLQTLLAHDESIWKTLSHKKITLAGLQAELINQRQHHMVQVVELEKKIRILSEKRDERKHLLARIQERKSLALAAVDALKKAARLLDDQIRAASPGREETGSAARPFGSYKGLLKMPVRGSIISFFGPYTMPSLNITGFKSGIDIEAAKGEPIQAVNPGKTLYAGWFKGYGNIIILDHGDNYCTVYAHAHEIFKQKGDRVAAGEVIATVGDTGSLQGPKLHFEIRHHGKPLDPLEWIEERSISQYDKTANR